MEKTASGSSAGPRTGSPLSRSKALPSSGQTTSSPSSISPSAIGQFSTVHSPATAWKRPSTHATAIRRPGRSAGWPGMVGGLDDWVADVKALLERTRRAAGELPVFLMGHSLGSLIAASYVIRAGGEGLAGLVLSSVAVLAGPAILESMADP